MGTKINKVPQETIELSGGPHDGEKCEVPRQVKTFHKPRELGNKGWYVYSDSERRNKDGLRVFVFLNIQSGAQTIAKMTGG